MFQQLFRKKKKIERRKTQEEIMSNMAALGISPHKITEYQDAVAKIEAFEKNNTKEDNALVYETKKQWKGWRKMRKKFMIILLGVAALLLSACTEADTVSHNLSKSADSFEVQRKIVFFNGITDNYLLTIEGLCSINVDDPKKISVTCKVGDEQYKKHYLGLSDNVTYFVEQTDAKHEDPFHYKVLFRPESILPDIDLQTSNGK